ncbi:hypothetical protein F0M18_09520 [Pseudohalioglobus sediminis]|uniref:Shikimate kinase n=1 Tax=Pseudohalioglobus sediminis TaxID=2606449 RepID=A0A5B0WZE1_9GAMM|nr:hypothetical protein [Pseudohalioglobus sediminis]KAA1191765.1 hypothetical protein F0M18_09520 [Pseudohalioglobus sediminis]
MTKDSDNLLANSAVNMRLFTAIKYIVYLLLSFNVYLFLQEELLALEHTFVDGFELSQVIQVFSATIDTAAWVILLLLFELETSVLDDRRIQGPVKWGLHGIRLLCYVAVFYAFTGYYAELVTLYEVTPMAGFDACASVGQGWSLLVDLDEYIPLQAQNCAAVAGEIYRVTGFDILAEAQVLEAARRLAWVDVINSAAWLLVVIVLEIEVRLQLRGDLSDRIMNVTKWVKLILYGTLFLAAGYWGVAGDFLDFWDAALWLFAFIFIELNVFEWQAETNQQDPATA